MLLGLSDEVISDALKNLAKADILVLRDNPCINYKNKMDLSKHLIAKFMEETPETSTDSLDSPLPRPKHPRSPRISTAHFSIWLPPLLRFRRLSKRKGK